MLEAAKVIPFKQADMTNIGHNNPPVHFDDDVEEVLRQGAINVCFDRLCRACLDRRLTWGHTAILSVAYRHTNFKHGMAWPSRQTIAKETGLELKTVTNRLYELRALGYIDWQRRRNPESGRSLLHYAVPAARVTREDFDKAFKEFLAALPAKTTRSPGSQTAPSTGSSHKTTRSPGSSAAKLPAAGASELPAARGKNYPQPGQQDVLEEELDEGKESVVASPSAPTPAASASRSRKPAPPKARTELRPDWSIKDNPEWGKWALARYTNVSREEVRDELYEFRDYHHKEGTTSTDWFASWRTWARKREKPPPWAKPGHAHRLWVKISTADDIDELDLVASKPEPTAPAKSQVDEDLEIWRRMEERRRNEDA